MNVRTIVKTTANVLVALGSYSIAREVIDNNTAEPDTTAQKALHYAGSAGIAGLVCDAASDHVSNGVDELFDIFESRKKPTS